MSIENNFQTFQPQITDVSSAAKEENAPKVSVIVPVYKVEKYLPECIESVLAQTFPDFELILVDDGSPDNSGKICDAYAARDSRIRAIHKENGGLSDARNAGIRAARGDLLMFLDGDDFWLGRDLLSCLDEAWCSRAPDCDFLMFNLEDRFPNGQRVRWKDFSPTGTAFSATKSERVVAMCKSGVFRMSAYCKLMDRAWIVKNELFFEKGLISEDTPWFANLMTRARNWRCVNVFGYAYRKQREGSITAAGTELDERRFAGVMRGIDELVHVADSSCWSRPARHALLSFAAFTLAGLVLRWNFLDKEKRKTIRNYSWLFRYRSNPKVFVSAWIIRIFGFSAACFFMNKLRLIMKCFLARARTNFDNGR